MSNAATPGGTAGDDGLLGGILAGIESWKSVPSRNKALKERVGSDLAPFLGGRAMEQLLSAVSEEGDNLLSTVEPVVALFLGCRAASALIDHIVGRSIPGAF